VSKPGSVPASEPPTGRATSRPTTIGAMGATAPARTGGLTKAASAAELRAATAMANGGGGRPADGVVGWGQDGLTQRREPGTSSMGHITYARKKVVHSVPFGVQPGSDAVRAPPTASERPGAAPKTPAKRTPRSANQRSANLGSPTRSPGCDDANVVERRQGGGGGRAAAAAVVARIGRQAASPMRR